MNRNRKLILLAALLVVVIAGATIAYNQLAPGASGPSGKADGAGAAQGDTVEAVQPNGDNGTDSTTGADSGAQDAEQLAAPDFTVYDADGHAVHLSDFAGEPVVINFWASWCPPCKAELPDFEAAYQANEKDGAPVRFLMVDLTDGERETKETADAFLAENGYTFPVYYDLDYSAAYTYGIRSIPMTLFVDADGYIADDYVGQINAQTLQEGLDKIR